jgi:hypothetical protein
MKTVPTFIANIALGAKEGYDGKSHTKEEILDKCQKFCNEVSLAVTIAETLFVYKNGNESGFIIGLINYPRFPSTPEEITSRAIELAYILKDHFNQYRVSIICSDNTYMIE